MNVWTRNAMAFIAGILILLVAALGWGYYANWNRYEKALGQLESRSERLDGLVSAGSQIEAELAAVRANVAPWLHSGGENAQNEVQQKLRELIANSGVTLVSSQAALESAPAGEAKLASVRLTATVSGEWSKLIRMAEVLQRQQPPFLVRTAIVSREGSPSGPGAQLARMTVQLDATMAPEKGQP